MDRIRGGLEIPLSIRLDPSPAAPRLHAVSDVRPAPGVRVFGPYLGSTKVRLALSALQRLHPLRYAGDSLTGTARELARARGADRADVGALAGAITAVLDREPAAVASAREALAARRDAAAQAQAYEAAARLQEEIAALDWVLAPQRVTAADPAHDEDVTGSSGDVLVRLRIRGGRLRGWEQGTGTDDGPPCPQAWEPFVRRNAELAAVLAASPVR